MNVTLCPILSDKYPNNGARKTEIKKTFPVILAASVCENPYLVMKNSFDMLLKQNNPTYINMQKKDIAQNVVPNSFKSLHLKSSLFSSGLSAFSCLSIFSAWPSNHAVIKAQMRERMHRIKPTIKANPRLVEAATGGVT